MPKRREDLIVERLCDMRGGFKLQVFKSGVDGDLHISVMKDSHTISLDSVEFCMSGCDSPHTRKALHGLLEAMQKDNKQRPQR